MKTKQNSVTSELKQKVDLFLSYWKEITFCLIVSILLGFIYLRYSTNVYTAHATIKIRDEKQSTKLPSIEEFSSQGLFSQGSDKIKDEMSVLRSRSISKKIVKNLNLNVRCFTQGKIKEKEEYRNPPVKISFFESDSIIEQVNTAIYIKIKSPTEFIMFENDGKSILERNDADGTIYAFGEKINTDYGGIVITPNIGSYAPKIGTSLKISISPVTSLVNHYTKNVRLYTDKGSSIINLELKETVAQKAVDYLDQLIFEYNNDVLFDKEEVVRITSDFINNRLQKVSEELEQVDLTAEQLQKQNNLTALSSQDNINLQAEQQLQTQISRTANNIQLVSYLQEELNNPNKSSDMLPADLGIGDSNTSQVIKSHNELVAQRDRILRNSTEKNPVVIQLNNQIETLQMNLKNSLNNIKETSELTLNSLNRDNSRIRGQLYNAPTKARQFKDIKRQQDIKESLFLYLLQKREESAISLGMYSPNAKIVDKAYSSFKPIAPNATIIYLSALILGLTLPIGLIYLFDLLDTKIYKKEDLANILDIPYLGDIPKSSKKHKLVTKVDYSSKAEAFRIIRSNIDFMLKERKDQTKRIFVTSTKAQEGKSHTSTNLASSISYSEKSVLLIELDIRVPKILDYLNISEKPKQGLTDFISDKSIEPEDIILKQKNNAFFDIIPSGTIPPNPYELLMSDRLIELFNYFDKKYDYIIADTSAVGIVSDTMLISNFADMFIYVVSANNVDKRLLQHVAQPLYNEKRLPRMTLLLNGVSLGKKGYGGYGYGYGYGSSPQKKKKWFQFG